MWAESLIKRSVEFKPEKESEGKNKYIPKWDDAYGEYDDINVMRLSNLYNHLN